MAVGAVFGTSPTLAPDNQPQIEARSEATQVQIIEIKEETIEDTALRILSEFRPITREIGYAIVEAETNFRNICNTKGCFFGIGPAQIVRSTFDEQCFGIVDNAEDNLRCMAELVDKEEYWRWEQTMDKWLYKLSPKTRDYVKVRCECVSYVRSQGIDIKEIPKPNSPPVIGALAIFSYGGVGHIAIVTGFREDGFTVKESNFSKCKITERLVKWDDERWNSIRKNPTTLIGFFK